MYTISFILNIIKISNIILIINNIYIINECKLTFPLRYKTYPYNCY